MVRVPRPTGHALATALASRRPASVLAAWPAPLRERMETTDGAETHEQEHARDREVSSASAADNLNQSSNAGARNAPARECNANGSPTQRKR